MDAGFAVAVSDVAEDDASAMKKNMQFKINIIILELTLCGCYIRFCWRVALFQFSASFGFRRKS